MQWLPECGSVALKAVEAAGFSDHQLDDLPDGHSAREAVRVHDQVGTHAKIVEGEVCLLSDEPTHALLPVAGRKFVSEFGPATLPQENLQ